MAGGLSDFASHELLDHLFGGNTAGNVYTPPTTLHIGLGTGVAGTDRDTAFASEVTGNNYSRASVANTTANWSAAAGTNKTNAAAITFPQASGSWGTITQFGVFDAATNGNLIAWGDLTTAKAVGANDTFSFGVGQLTFGLD